MGHTQKKFNDISYGECLTKCCENPSCRTFDYRNGNGYNCAIIYKTKEEVGDNFKEGCDRNGWNHYELGLGGKLSETGVF